MKIVLAAINAKYIHSNLAVYSLRAYAKEYRHQIKLAEFTINHYSDDILQAIYKEKPDLLAFSCYIWNISMVEELCTELRKVLPETRIWLGGPEVSYDAEARLKAFTGIDGIILGEGEETFKELLDYYEAGRGMLRDVKGIAYRPTARRDPGYGFISEGDGEERKDKKTRESPEITFTLPRGELDLSTLPFPYEGVDLKELENRILYYETMRGCPFSCSYCLSSIDKRVRIRNMALVEKELEYFLKGRVPQVKFVDRTFNCNPAHALSVWKFIQERDNGITNFHFEISADILNEEELDLLNTLRPGLVQLEIGVQSTHGETIEAICRRMDLDKLAYAVRRIQAGKNIHQHLDLIAGLPYEDYDTFRCSFNRVYALRPDQLQLGFLKVLKGSGMHEAGKAFGIVHKAMPPYEVLYTKWLSYDDVLKLKAVEDMVEVYYNSGQFVHTLRYLEHFFLSPFDLYASLGEYYAGKRLFGISQARIRRYEILIEFMKEREDKLQPGFRSGDFTDILVHDLFLRENLKSRPSFARDQEPYKKRYRKFCQDEKQLMSFVPGYRQNGKTSGLKQYLHLERYGIDVEKTALTGITIETDRFVLYDYLHRSPLNSEARTLLIDL